MFDLLRGGPSFFIEMALNPPKPRRGLEIDILDWARSNRGKTIGAQSARRRLYGEFCISRVSGSEVELLSDLDLA